MGSAWESVGMGSLRLGMHALIVLWGVVSVRTLRHVRSVEMAIIFPKQIA
jgi:hypothetical protein